MSFWNVNGSEFSIILSIFSNPNFEGSALTFLKSTKNGSIPKDNSCSHRDIESAMASESRHTLTRLTWNSINFSASLSEISFPNNGIAFLRIAIASRGPSVIVT